MSPKDPYDVLGVEPGCTESEIRAAYRQRARTDHPDISDAPNAEEGQETDSLGEGRGWEARRFTGLQYVLFL